LIIVLQEKSSNSSRRFANY